MSPGVKASSHIVRPGLRLVLSGRPVADVELADTYLRRLRGMLARRRLPEALLLVPGGSVHGLGMTTALDVALLAPVDPAGHGRHVVGRHRVVRTASLAPFGLVGSARGVRSVLEAPAGSFRRWGLRADDEVELQAVPQT